MPLLSLEAVSDFSDYGIRAFTTTRDAGTFGLSGDDAVGDVLDRWTLLQRECGVDRLVVPRQVHGTRVLEHASGWSGWLRAEEADGHLSIPRGTALAITLADCVPVFVAHASGAVALLHSGWRGTAGGIVSVALAALGAAGCPAAELRVHLGPAICGRCYQVSAEVRQQLTEMPANRPGQVDLRALIAEHARAAGVRALTVSHYCTRCDNDRFFSHRAGDAGRHAAVIVAA